MAVTCRIDAADSAIRPGELRALLLDLLGCVRRHGEAPLQGCLDGRRIVQGVWPHHAGSLGADPEGGMNEVLAGLDRLVAGALAEGGPAPEGPGPASFEARCSECRPAEGPLGSLAGWLEAFDQTMQDVHPRAILIGALRLEGYEDRDIARRLDLPARLVARVAGEMRRAWQAERGVSADAGSDHRECRRASR